ncbi:hypothetical protein WJX84_005355 [Apatococcus fuscideae]|uniref:Uncharacterized protein n=1 Tax=Apatococcus fuscideae TaxID=2026836 RepID=A0AAW1T3W1_9CHLO
MDCEFAGRLQVSGGEIQFILRFGCALLVGLGSDLTCAEGLVTYSRGVACAIRPQAQPDTHSLRQEGEPSACMCKAELAEEQHREDPLP